ncbi:MAG: RNA-directed DNA polymerase [Bacteroidota bacterium]
MKRANHLFPRIIDPENLRLAFWKAQKGKNGSFYVQRYRQHLYFNLQELAEHLETGQVQVGQYYVFHIHDPKERLICASSFSEQVLHHALMNICHPYFERKQIFDSYASRPGKGVHAALNRAQVFTRTYPWYLKLDVRKFFGSIYHPVIKQQLKGLFKEEHLLWIFHQIIDSYTDASQRGLPIGNLCSQYFANHYLTGLDHYLKEVLRIPGYLRYMDDMILWHTQKQALQKAEKAIHYYVETKLHQQLKPSQLNRCKRGVPMLGYRLFPTHRRLSQRSKRRFIRKIHVYKTAWESGHWSEDEYQRRIQALLAFLSHADAATFQRDVIFDSEGWTSSSS